ncbi:family 43 glycosylhydrolase [Sphingomonas sp. Leaf21]|uniref:family 43 glycosylhydrolase n=1 Tax=Sphingomonas sp. Leaf21 TaxID=2876550 RepID=UPI001E5412EA|nr:family 43 glycosylhydrolase [Sphingomonas sp. Leaf21]
MNGALRPLSIVCLALTAAAPAADPATDAVAQALRNQPAFASPVRGNLTLPDDASTLTGLADVRDPGHARISWRSSDPAVISDADRGRGADIVRKGRVTRGRADRRVRLTATVAMPGHASVSVPIDVIVKAAPPAAHPPSAYMFVYFTGNTIDGEKLRFAVSEGNNALQWKSLNDARPILESHEGTRGLRDPFIMRSAEGDRFFLLATDLSTGRTGWGGSTSRGSRHLEIWESTDLIHWGKQRHVRVNLPDAGMTWAPEATYDPAIGAYVVYWTSTLYKDADHKVEDGDGPQILRATTRDFRTFTTPEPWFKADDVPGAVKAKGMIDATVMADKGRYYRFTKVSDAAGCPSSDILAQTSTNLRADGRSGAWTIIDRCIGRRAGTPEVEGPTAFRANPGDTSGFRYFLWVDDYGGVGYIPLATQSLATQSPDGKIAWSYPRRFNLPKSPRHGTVLPITAAEHARLVAHWNAVAADEAALAERWVVAPVLASGTRLPVPAGYVATWRADGRALPEGVLTNPDEGARRTRLDGTLMRPDGTTLTKTFNVTLLGKSARQLEAYARTPSTAQEANQPTVARSVHLSLTGADGLMTPMNDDYGIVFARGTYTGVDRVALRGVADPSLFHFADGSIGVIASRVNMDGVPDPAPSATVIFQRDPKSGEFVELGTLDLQSDQGIGQPRAIWDSANRHYVVSWTDRAGQPRWTTVADLARVEWRETPYYPAHGGRRGRIASTGNVGGVRTGVVTVTAQDTLPIDAATATALTARFGRIVNRTADVAPQVIARGRTGDLAKVRVTLGYSDGSTATRAVDWDAADMAQLSTPGLYRVHGTIRQPRYPAIFAYNRADPDIYRWEHDGRVRYLFTATDDTNNDNVGSAHLPLRIADTIEGLSDEHGGRDREVDLLNRRTRRDATAAGRVIAGCYWAPEIHEIGGKLSILFAPCFNPTDDRSNEGGSWSTVQSHIIQLRDGGDPANPADWSKPMAIGNADGTLLGRPEMPANISLDMSYFELRGQGYYTWSQRYIPTSGAMGDPLTWIARVDPDDPTRLSGPASPIIAPETSVEENLAEGAFALVHGGRVTLVYSSSGVSPTYVVNGISAPLDSDPTRIDAWRKWSSPLQKSVPMPAGERDYRRYEQGPGHGSFTSDEDGNPLYIYHSWGNGVGGDGRDARVRRVHWAMDGRPLLEMRDDEEVAPGNRRVAMEVRVR